MPACSALNCSFRGNSETSGKSVHRFPFKRPQILKKWILNVRRKNWYPSPRSLLCSDHFKPDCFTDTAICKKYLKPDAVPTVFNYTNPLEPKMGCCVAYGCKNRAAKKDKRITFHSFPKDPIRRRQWILAVQRKNWIPSHCSKLCSAHFTEDMIDRTSMALVRLKENAVPTIFKHRKIPCKVLNNVAKDEPSESFLDENGILNYPAISSDPAIDDGSQNDLNDIAKYLISMYGEGKNDATKYLPNESGISLNTSSPTPASVVQLSSVAPGVHEDFSDALIAFHNIQNAGVIPDNAKDNSMSFIMVESTFDPNKKKVEELEEILKNCKKRIKILHQSRRRHVRIIGNLKVKLRELEACRSSDEDVVEDLSEDEIYAELSKYQETIYSDDENCNKQKKSSAT